MLQTPALGTPFYRVTDRGRSWPDVLSGAGAYFSFGCRYNRVHQKTVYVAEDPPGGHGGYCDGALLRRSWAISRSA
jgi:RES domain-containing protein